MGFLSQPETDAGSQELVVRQRGCVAGGLASEIIIESLLTQEVRGPKQVSSAFFPPSLPSSFHFSPLSLLTMKELHLVLAVL